MYSNSDLRDALQTTHPREVYRVGEVILEGYITERQEEAGLWCDAWQNYTRPSKQNVFRVEAVTMRERPLYVSNWPGVSVQTSLSGAAEVYGLLWPHFRDIRGINFPFVQ